MPKSLGDVVSPDVELDSADFRIVNRLLVDTQQAHNASYSFDRLCDLFSLLSLMFNMLSVT